MCGHIVHNLSITTSLRAEEPQRMDHGQAVKCDLLIINGFLVTRDGAVAVRGNRILAVGPTDELQARYGSNRTIDASGRIVMPGLVNTHNDSPLMVTRGMVEDLGF